MPNMVDYVITHTGQKPHFVGHSMVNKLLSIPVLYALVYVAAVTYHG
jgi:hypothetical protein